ncbi:MAG: HNH endonuclease signature motif containing protein [Acidimicrobiia bacterium]
MYENIDSAVLTEKLRCDIGLLREFLSEPARSNSVFVDSGLVKSLVELRDSLDGVCALVMSEYINGGSWANDNYLTGKSAIVHETGQSRKKVDVDIACAKVLSKYSCYMEKLSCGKISSEHIKLVTPLLSDSYIEFFDDDNKLLCDIAVTLPVSQFNNVVRHWKNMVDAIRDDNSEDQQSFESRRLFFSELADGQYFIQGQFDPISGKIIRKALEAITQKLWSETEPQMRHEYSPAQMRADALVMLAQNFVGDKTLTSPTLTADIVIDINDITPGNSTTIFLKTMLEKQTPIISTHSKGQLKQMLCDCEISTPIKLQTGRYDLGRKVRTAPTHLKKQLVLETQTCSIKGCVAPAKWCDAHHIKHWIDGGTTSLDNLVLLCRRHHTITHQNKTTKLSTTNKKQYADLPPPI